MSLGNAELETPLGLLYITFDSNFVYRVDFEGETPRVVSQAPTRQALPPELRDRLNAYMEGDCAALDSIAVETGGTAFQREVWSALRRIPAGSTISYGELAARIGRPRAVRAVGLANGANPVPLIVPCHRVIGANGALTGYGGGVWRKRWLLEHEAASVGGGHAASLFAETSSPTPDSRPRAGVRATN